MLCHSKVMQGFSINSSNSKSKRKNDSTSKNNGNSTSSSCGCRKTNSNCYSSAESCLRSALAFPRREHLGLGFRFST